MLESHLKAQQLIEYYSRKARLVSYFSSSGLIDSRNYHQLWTSKYLQWKRLYNRLKASIFFLHHDEASSCPKQIFFLLLPVLLVFCSPVLPKIT